MLKADLRFKKFVTKCVIIKKSLFKLLMHGSIVPGDPKIFYPSFRHERVVAWRMSDESFDIHRHKLSRCGLR